MELTGINCNSTSLNIFKGRLVQFVRPLENSMFTCNNPIGIKCLTKWRLGFSYLCYHKFKHSFLDAVDPLFSCSTKIENTAHYFLHCLNLSRWISNCWQIHYCSRWNQIVQTFLYGNPDYSVNDYKVILDASIKVILETKKFDRPIF